MIHFSSEADPIPDTIDCIPGNEALTEAETGI